MRFPFRKKNERMIRMFEYAVGRQKWTVCFAIQGPDQIRFAFGLVNSGKRRLIQPFRENVRIIMSMHKRSFKLAMYMDEQRLDQVAREKSIAESQKKQKQYKRQRAADKRAEEKEFMKNGGAKWLEEHPAFQRTEVKQCA
jgi:hypothetical protein